MAYKQVRLLKTNKQKKAWARKKSRLKQSQYSVKVTHVYVQKVMAFKTQRNSHQMPCSSTSFMVPVLLSTPNTFTSLLEWTDITCLSPWENAFRLTGSSLEWGLERYRGLQTAHSPMSYQTPWLGEDACLGLTMWCNSQLLRPNLASLNQPSESNIRCQTSSTWPSGAASRKQPRFDISTEMTRAKYGSTNIQCSSGGRNPFFHKSLFCYVLSGTRQTSWVQFWFKLDNNERIGAITLVSGSQCKKQQPRIYWPFIVSKKEGDMLLACKPVFNAFNVL